MEKSDYVKKNIYSRWKSNIKVLVLYNKIEIEFET